MSSLGGTCDISYRPRWHARAGHFYWVPSTKGAGAQDLVKSREEVEAAKVEVCEAPILSRPLPGHLSKARHERVELVDLVRVEERKDQGLENLDLSAGCIVLISLTQRRGCLV